jgi:dTMP kinase
VTRSRAPRGLLVAIEGIDGAGKSTFTRALAGAARRRGLSVRIRREPADRRLGAIAQSASVGDPWTGAIYFTVDRFLARPAVARDLGRYDLVVQDRSLYSTLAYQGSALPAADQHRLEAIEAASAIVPDRVVLLDLPAPAALARLDGRGRRRQPLERRRTLARVARAYRALARRHRWIVLDAREPPRALLELALSRLALRPRRRLPGGRRRGRR